jgi:capsular polysaccharide transport system permease protein
MVAVAPLYRGGYWATRWRIWPALFLRDMAGGEGTLGIIKRFLEPALMVMGTVALSWLISRQPPYGNSILLWSVTGVGPIFLFVHVSKYISRGVSTKGPFMSDFDHVLVTAVIEFTFVSLSMVGFFALLYFTVTKEALPHDLGHAVRAWFVVGLLAFGIGMIVRILSRLYRIVHALYPAMNRMLLHMSGVYFVMDSLPPELRSWLTLNPLVSGITWFRMGFFPQFPTHSFSLSYLLCWAVGAFLVGLTLQISLGDRIEEL